VITLIPVLFWPLFFEIPAVLYLFFWFFSQIISGTIASLVAAEIGGVAWWAHVGGFITGVILHPFFISIRKCRKRKWYKDEFGLEGVW